MGKMVYFELNLLFVFRTSYQSNILLYFKSTFLESLETNYHSMII